MERRRFLELTGFLSVTSFAGCTESSQNNGSGGLEFFREELDDNNIDVIKLEIVDENTELKYQTDRTTNQGLGDEIGVISASYVSSKQNGLSTNRLVSTINDGDTDVATWHIRAEWIEQFENGEISPDEFTGKILNTVELIE